MAKRKRLTLEEFFELLANVAWKRDVEWYLEDGCITSSESLCPIHEVYLADDPDHSLLDYEDYMLEAKHLGLSVRDARAIVAAADNSSGQDVEVRRRMLAICEPKEC